MGIIALLFHFFIVVIDVIYLAVINKNTFNLGGMVRSKHAARFFCDRFDSLDDVCEYVILRHTGARGIIEAPYGDFKRTCQLAVLDNNLVYTWDLKSATADEVKDIARHITAADWAYLIDRNPDYYDVCIDKVGWVAGDSLSDHFIINHHHKVKMGNVRDDSAKRHLSFYDWVRLKRPSAFKKIEGSLLVVPEHTPTKHDVVKEILERIKSLNIDVNEKGFNVYAALGGPEVMAAKSKYYKRLKFETLLDYTKYAYRGLNKDNVRDFSDTLYFKNIVN